MCRLTELSREARYAIDVIVFLTVVIVGFFALLNVRSGFGLTALFLYVLFVMGGLAAYAFNVSVRLARLEDAVFGKKKE